ncbi:MAG: class I SAM-dependent methyltransferase [Bryobacteraceae bacterium]
MNCDAIAPFYRWIEYASFGSLLERVRCSSLARLAPGAHAHALVIGDGDGRFLAALSRRLPNLKIDAVDSSRAMIALASRRGPGVRFHHRDARNWIPPAVYSLVVTHFFLDCLTQDELDALVQRVAGCVEPGALWIVSEFAIPRSGWRNWRARFWLRAMYLFFGAATGLEVRRLPDHSATLGAHCFVCESRETFSAGLVAAEVWRFTPTAPPPTSSSLPGTPPSPSDRPAGCP